MRFAHRDQRGITLIEMTVAIALIGLIAAGIAMTISQVMAVNSRTSSKMVALRQVQQAGDRVSKDVLQARTVTPTGATGFPLILTVPYWEDDGSGLQEKAYQVRYVFNGDSLEREYRSNVNSENPDYTNTIARYIDTGDTTFVQAGDAYVFRVTAVAGTQTETREYEVKPRPGS